MEKFQRIYLIGPMGAGKTTIGKMVARELNFDFIDSDHEIEARTGVDISTIFDYEGDEGFRERETCVLESLSQKNEHVIATGGGAVMREKNRNVIRSSGYVVYLKVSVRQSVIRTRKDTNRPILQSGDPYTTLKKLAKERTPLYESIANLTVDTDKHRTNKLKLMIANGFRQANQKTESSHE